MPFYSSGQLVEQKRSCCWGIMGAADIARKNWQAILHSGNGYVKSVASRNLENAAALIAACELSVPFPAPVQPIAGYQNLLSDPEIDAVYIPLPTVIRDQWAFAAIEAGKHVLIEKPCSQSADNLKKLIETAQSKNLQVMDGVMFTHTNRFAALMDVIHRQRSIGKVRRIASQFSFCADQEWASSNIRCDSRLEPFGALGDLGWYCIRIALAAMGDTLPEQVIGNAIQTFQHPDAEDSVPTEFEGTLLFANNVTASFYCSFITELQQWTNVSGTEGYVAIEDFVLPFHDRQPCFEIFKSEFVTRSCDFNMHRKGQTFSFDESPNSGVDSPEANLFRDFGDCVLNRNTDSNWSTASLKTQIVMDALMHSARNRQEPTDVSPVSI